jgi:GT2 family glycosyltransferase
MPALLKKKIFAVVPAHNRKALTLKCLSVLERVRVPRMTLVPVVVDDGSQDGTGEAVRRRFPKAVVLSGDGSLWWSGAMNLGVAYALEDPAAAYILSLNDDVQTTPSSLERLAREAVKRPGSLAAPLACFSPGGRVNQSGNHLEKGLGWIPDHARWPRGDFPAKPYLSHATAGYCVLIPAEAFRRLGLYAEKFLPHYHADLEFTCRAVRGGFPLWVYPHLRVFTDSNPKMADLLRDPMGLAGLRRLFWGKGAPWRPDFYFHFYRLTHPEGALGALGHTLSFYAKAAVKIGLNLVGLGRILGRRWPARPLGYGRFGAGAP